VTTIITGGLVYLIAAALVAAFWVGRRPPQETQAREDYLEHQEWCRKNNV